MRPDIAAEVPALRILFQEARRVGDARTAAGCLERLSWLAWVLLDGDLADECAREAAALDVPERSPEAFRLAVRRAGDELQNGDAKRALARLDAAERAGERLDIDAFVGYLGVRADVLCALGDAEAAIECARLALSIAQKRPNASAAFLSALYVGYTYEASGQLDESLAAYDRAAQLAVESELGWESALAHARSAWVAVMRGDAQGARDRFVASLRTSERTPWLDVTRVYVGVHLGVFTGDRGLIDAFADDYWIGRVLASRDAYAIGRTLCAFYDLERYRGDLSRARELSAIALRRCNSAACVWPIVAPVAKYGDEEQLQRARALLDQFPDGHPVASAHRRLFDALLAERRGDASASAQRAGEAYLLFEPLGLKYYATLALALAGRFTEARARLRAYGFDGTERRVEARAARGRPRLSYEGAQQRREVFDLLLEGKSSREIANRLGLSERTIKTRISEIYTRTGTNKRAGLTSGMASLL